jgi:tripartite-type tricarboxylate transporter receptor subunit TctC
MSKMWITTVCGLAMMATSLPGNGALAADPVADFYKGKQIRFVIRTPPGGDYDAYTRLFARFMGKHIPGNPTLVPTNMTGGGGIIAANYMANVAPKDGTVIGIVGQGLPLDQALGLSKQLQADFKTFPWIGNIVYSNQLLGVWHTSPVKTLEEAKKKEILIGTTGAGSASTQFPAFYNNVLGTKFKMVTGYRGGQAIDLAMERGEVHGRGTNPYSGYMASKPDWLPSGKLIPLIQAGFKKEPELPNVPLIVDQAVKPEDKPLLEMMGRTSDIGRPLATTPGVPAERVAALRDAFQRTIVDKEMLEEAKKQHMVIRPMTGEELTTLINSILDAPADVKARMKLAIQPKAEQMTKTQSGGKGTKK